MFLLGFHQSPQPAFLVVNPKKTGDNHNPKKAQKRTVIGRQQGESHMA